MPASPFGASGLFVEEDDENIVNGDSQRFHQMSNDLLAGQFFSKTPKNSKVSLAHNKNKLA